MHLGGVLTVVGLAVDIAAIWLLFVTTTFDKLEAESRTAENEEWFSHPSTPRRMGRAHFQARIAVHQIWKRRVAWNRILQRMAVVALTAGFVLQIAGQIV